MDAIDITFGEPYIIHHVLITFNRSKIKGLEGEASPFLGAKRRPHGPGHPPSEWVAWRGRPPMRVTGASPGDGYE
jgi:hypothetical protein